MTATGHTSTSYPLVIDQQTIAHVERQMGADFVAGLTTHVGNHALSIDDAGLFMGPDDNSQALMRWDDIEVWAFDHLVFLAQSSAGNSIIIPRRQLREHTSMQLIDICRQSLPKAEVELVREPAEDDEAWSLRSWLEGLLGR